MLPALVLTTISSDQGSKMVDIHGHGDADLEIKSLKQSQRAAIPWKWREKRIKLINDVARRTWQMIYHYEMKITENNSMKLIWSSERKGGCHVQEEVVNKMVIILLQKIQGNMRKKRLWRCSTFECQELKGKISSIGSDKVRFVDSWQPRPEISGASQLQTWMYKICW